MARQIKEGRKSVPAAAHQLGLLLAWIHVYIGMSIGKKLEVEITTYGL